ncbi:12449_t:CDS:2 [Cetraspora pellucida]|uniref:12449_t:CDS:1 n=1 Tax=Cetraspora pellucida TaxID=1433469 RepID=A0ACA9PCI5_9GLOM|nr:12449_t:CDS:2 [Cetraspora pellucida]
MRLEFSELGFEFYNNYEKDKNKLKVISDNIQKNNTVYQDLKEYENKIYQDIIPMAKKMQNKIKESELHQFTKGYDIVERIGRCMDKLDESLETLIVIYNRIESYQEQEKLAQYIENIKSSKAQLK